MVVGFRYVLKQIRDVGGNLTFNELAKKLDISMNQLNGMIDMMEKMGYLEITDIRSCSLISGSCSGCCNRGCGSAYSGIPGVTTRTYILTQKGEKVCDRS
ncbi:MAG: FeoC-like transcriptional regulator [Halobacteriota archaeon]